MNTAARSNLDQKTATPTDAQPDQSRDPRDTRERAAASRSSSADSNWCPRTMKELVQMVSGRTGLAKQNTLQPFVGQLLRVTGKTSSVERYERSLPIHVGVNTADGIYVQCWMREGHHEQYLSQLNIGDSFSAVGMLQNVSERSISLDKCDLEF